MRSVYLLALALVITAGCQAGPTLYDGASADARFLFGGQWNQKEENAISLDHGDANVQKAERDFGGVP